MVESKPSENTESTSGSGKPKIRIWARNLICPENDCGNVVYPFTIRENVVDVSQPLKCVRCGKKLKPELVEAATDQLTSEEAARFTPKK